jgi:hypothetical protein
MGIPYYRARYASAENRAGVIASLSGHDAVVCSWEPLDALALDLSPKAILIVHNVTSLALGATFGKNPLVAIGAARLRAWERTSYRGAHLAAVVALARLDFAYLEQLPEPPRLGLLPPGMPPCFELADDATVLREIVISGTYDWFPKRRDAVLFAREYAGRADRMPIRAEALPAEAMQRLMPAPLPSDHENCTAIRFGLITDRFEAGHKLKTMAYIASNQIVLSFADVAIDFVDIPDSALFIRRLTSVADIADQVEAILAIPVAEVRQRFVAFRQCCERAFTWKRVAEMLLEIAEQTGQPYRPTA